MYITAYQLITECILLFIIPWDAMISIFFYRSYQLVIHNPIHLPIRVESICRETFGNADTTCYALKIIVFIGRGMFLDTPCLVTKGRESSTLSHTEIGVHHQSIAITQAVVSQYQGIYPTNVTNIYIR